MGTRVTYCASLDEFPLAQLEIYYLKHKKISWSAYISGCQVIGLQRAHSVSKLLINVSKINKNSNFCNNAII